MKKIIILIIAITIYSNINTQINPIILEGIWKYQSGNEVFIVNIWIEDNVYKGHYKKILVDANGNQISEIYNSKKLARGTTDMYWPYSIYASLMLQKYSLRASLLDNTANNMPPNRGYIHGDLRLKILNPECFNTGINCPLKLEWILKIP
jgi:hypothetical protein